MAFLLSTKAIKMHNDFHHCTGQSPGSVHQFPVPSTGRDYFSGPSASVLASFCLLSNITQSNPIKTQVRSHHCLPQILACFHSSFRVKLRSLGGSGDALYLTSLTLLSLGLRSSSHSGLCCFRNTSDTVLPQGLCTVFPACNTLPPSSLHSVPHHLISRIPQILAECLLWAST